MVRSIGAQLGLLAFAAAILAGLYAGNSPATILIRALLVMAGACAAGQGLGWASKQVLRDHLQRKKLAMDKEHYDALREVNDSDNGQTAAAPQPAEAG